MVDLQVLGSCFSKGARFGILRDRNGVESVTSGVFACEGERRGVYRV